MSKHNPKLLIISRDRNISTQTRNDNHWMTTPKWNRCWNYLTSRYHIKVQTSNNIILETNGKLETLGKTLEYTKELNDNFRMEIQQILKNSVDEVNERTEMTKERKNQ